MDLTSWAAVAALVGVISTVGGWLIRLSTQLSQAKSTADAANKSAAEAKASIEKNERELVEHRVYVAREYVSNQTIAALEGKLIEAINRLGDRLDSLFIGRHAAPDRS